MFYVSWGLSIAAILGIGFSKTLRYKTPWNYLFLVSASLNSTTASISPKMRC